MPKPARLEHGDTSHTFTGLVPENGGYYLAALVACVDSARTNCGSEVTSNEVSLPVIGISPSGVIWIGEQKSTAVSAVPAGLKPGQAYTVRFSVAMDNSEDLGDLRFNECKTNEPPVIARDFPIPTSNDKETLTKNANIYSCGTGTGTLSAKLISGSTEVASHSRVPSLVPIPTGVRVNGHGGSTSHRFNVRWDPVANATSYKIRYATADNSSGFVTSNSQGIWTEVTHTSQTLERTIIGLTANRIYEVQIQAFRGLLKTGWSNGAYVKPTSALPAFTSEPKPEFAKIPLQRYWPSGNYTYHLCSNRFADPDRNAPSVWMNAIRAAINALVNGVVWNTNGTNIVTATGNVDHNCTDDEVTGDTGHNAVFLAGDISDLMKFCGVPMDDKSTLACADSRPIEGGIAVTGHVIFRPAALHRDWNPRGSNSDPTRCSKLYGVALHETGHVFGLGHINSDRSMVSSIMKTMYEDRDGCAPSAYDVSVLMGIYQSSQ